MKKIFAILLLAVLASCAMDEQTRYRPAENTDISRARAFVEAQTNRTQTRGVNKNHPAIGAFEADWSRARVHKNKEQKLTVTEVPTRLVQPYLYTVLVERLGQTISLTRQEPHTRILVYDYRGKDKSISILLATLLPDESWVGDLSELRPRPVESDFSGVTIYSSADGTPLRGERWDGGKATHDLYFDAEDHGEPAKDLRIGMGFETGPTTRGGRNSESNPDMIEDVKVIGKGGGTTYPLPDYGEDDENEDLSDEPSSGGGGSRFGFRGVFRFAFQQRWIWHWPLVW